MTKLTVAVHRFCELVVSNESFELYGYRSGIVKWTPVPHVAGFSVTTSSGFVLVNDLFGSCSKRTVATTNELSKDFGERPILAVLGKEEYELMNGCIVGYMLQQLEESPPYTAAILYYPFDSVEKDVVRFCVNELAAVRLARTREPFEKAPKFNAPEWSNKGWGKSYEPYKRHWESALALLAESSHLHDIVAERMFGKTRDKLKPGDYERLLSYQVGKKSIKDFLARYSEEEPV